MRARIELNYEENGRVSAEAFCNDCGKHICTFVGPNASLPGILQSWGCAFNDLNANEVARHCIDAPVPYALTELGRTALDLADALEDTLPPESKVN